MKKVLSLFLIVCTLAASSTANPANAGGWGVTTLDGWPQTMVAGKTFTVTFVVRQHGNHVNTSVEPEFDFHNQATGKVLRVKAKLLSRLERFMAVITFPSAGEWEGEIISFPQQRLPNVMVTKVDKVIKVDKVEQGKMLFVAKGCFMCHAHSNITRSGEYSGAYGAGGAPTLTPNKWDAAYLRTWLKNPKAVKPTTQMPNLELKDKEIESLVAFLTAKLAN